MLNSATRRADNGTFELVVMLALAGLSFLGVWVYLLVPCGAAILTASTLHEYAYLQPRFVRARASRLLAGSILATVATSLAFASLCFGIGRIFAWLIAG
jgi:hypothetical protein